MFKGIITALITPFSETGAVDEQAFRKVVDYQINQGVHGLVPCGTTGESPTLSHEEHNLLVEVCVQQAKGKVPVIAGTGSNSTEEAIFLTQHAAKAGASGALVVMPYYNKPTQEGLYQHYKAIHDATNIPIIIYNIPGRSVVNMTDDNIARLAELPRIAGVKDATGDLTRPLSLTSKLKRADFSMLSGEDATALSFNASGGVGCISVTSNIAPKMCAEVQNLWFAGEITKAMQLTQKLFPLHNSMFLETNPAPVKYAASLLGLCRPDLRLPLVQISEDTKTKIKHEMSLLGLI